MTGPRTRWRALQALLASALVCYGVSLWSIPAALVLGGLIVLADAIT